MKRVSREEVLSLDQYNQIRPNFREKVLKAKEVRRIHLGDYLTFLFENHDTVLYQVQEMMRAEGIRGEKEIAHEVATYNELLGGVGELGATLLIEIPDKNERDTLLSKWLGLPESLYIITDSGSKCYATVDERQVGGTRISSVHYLIFPLKGQTPDRIGCDHPDYKLEQKLSIPQKNALIKDMMGLN